jgi:hypothetical protein
MRQRQDQPRKPITEDEANGKGDRNFDRELTEQKKETPRA